MAHGGLCAALRGRQLRAVLRGREKDTLVIMGDLNMREADATERRKYHELAEAEHERTETKHELTEVKAESSEATVVNSEVVNPDAKAESSDSDMN